MSKTIQFTDTSTNANTYFWDFGDGNTSTERNPIHTYQEDGEYVVVHTVFNDSGQASTEQTISLGITQADEQTQIDDTEPNPINPPSGYNPLQGEFLAGTISPQGQWIWNGQAWNVLEPEPSAPPIGYNPLQGQFQVGALSSNEQWVWDGYQWNLNVGDEGQEPVQESPQEDTEESDESDVDVDIPEEEDLRTGLGGDTDEQTQEGDTILDYNITLNEESEDPPVGHEHAGAIFDYINFNVNQSGPFMEGDEVELRLDFTTGGMHLVTEVELRPFITTPADLQIELIEETFIPHTQTQSGIEFRQNLYRFIMPGQDVSINAIAYLP